MGREADTLAKLTAPAADVWMASAGDEGPYLVPLTMAERVQAWREYNELAGRQLMRDGAWLA